MPMRPIRRLPGLAILIVMGACGGGGSSPITTVGTAPDVAPPVVAPAVPVPPTTTTPTDPSPVPTGQVYQSSFESVADFNGFYIAPQNQYNSASHMLSAERVHSGTLAHKGWIYGANSPSTALQNNNHRAYPTVQLYKAPGGAFKTPVLIEFWVWLDVSLAPGEWFSFATLDHTTLDTWDAVLVNLSDQGFVHLMHVPFNGQGVRDFQTSTHKFPMKQWVKLSVCLHFDPAKGFAKVWQDGQLVSSATVGRGAGMLTQTHFGLYAPPSVATGVVYNDDLLIKELGCS